MTSISCHMGLNLDGCLLLRSARSVLRVLAGTTQPLTGREVARLSSLSQNSAYGS